MSDDPKSMLDVPGQFHSHEVLHEPTRIPYIPAFYAVYYLAMAKTARELGYALALHGTMQRDCDVIAVAWTEEAASAEQLINTLVERHGFMLRGGRADKPHGRYAWSLLMGGHCYFDVSVIPPRG